MRLTPTHDLNAAQIADLARTAGADRIEAIAYQHLPVFHTEHCVFCRFLSTGTSYKDCGRPCEKHRVELRDESGRSHPVLADVGCRNTVFGAEAQEASQHLAAWTAAGIRHFRLEFAHETAEEVTRVTRAFQGALAGGSTFGDLGRALKACAPGGVTAGESLFVAKDYLALPILQSEAGGFSRMVVPRGCRRREVPSTGGVEACTDSAGSVSSPKVARRDRPQEY